MLLPLSILDSQEGLVLRRYLVQKHHLEALIELPTTQRQHPALTLMLLRPVNSLSRVAFISSKVVLPIGSKRKQLARAHHSAGGGTPASPRRPNLPLMGR
jgi:hypothetical protein